MRALFRFGTVVALVLCAAPAHALDPDRRVSQLSRAHWDRKQGLPSSNVAALAQTSDGFLWIGTSVGVVRFDGRRFQTYRKSQHPELPSDDIHSLAAEGETLWIGTSAGVARLAGGRIEAMAGSPVEWAKTMVADRSGHLFVMTPTGLFIRENGAFARVADPEGARLIDGELELAPDGAVWIYSAEKLWRWRAGALELVRGGGFLHRLVADPDGSLWAVGDDAIVHLGPAAGAEARVAIPRELYFALVRDPAGSLWMSSGLGLTRRTAAGALQTLPPTALGSLPQNLLVDREGNLWVGTEATGLYRFSDGAAVPWSIEEGLPSRVPISFFEDASGVYVTTDSGISRVAGDKLDAPFADITRPVIALRIEPGRTWIGSGEGLVLRAGAARERRVRDNIVIMMDRRADGLWIASQTGLDRLDDDGKVVEHHGVAQGAPTNVFISMRLARDGAVWAGYQAGVCRIADAKLHCFGPAEGGPTGSVEYILEDADGAIWLGTSEDGLYRVRGDRFERFTTRDGLPSDTHYAVLEDDRGHLWTSSSVGVARIDKASLGAGPAKVRLFDERDGMRSADCFGGGNTGLRASDGKLWFATGEGVAVFDPARADPPPALAPARIDARTQDDRGWLTLRYSAPTLRHGDELTFRHQLVGFDEGWETPDEPVASYTNVPPGTYRFVAQARVGAGAWGPAVEETITVAARWWQTAVFKGGAFAVAALLLFGLYRLRVVQLLRRRRQTEEVERMAAYGAMVAGVAHEVRQPMFALGTTAYVLQQKLADRADVAPQLALVSRETKRVNAIMDELLAFARPPSLTKTWMGAENLLREAADLFAAEHDPDGALAVAVEAASGARLLVDEARMVQVLVNLMGNAKKHAAGITRIRLAANGPTLVVENDGAGIAAADLPHLFEPFYGAGENKGSGLGLAIVKRLVELHGGRIQVASDAAGTRFTIVLP